MCTDFKFNFNFLNRVSSVRFFYVIILLFIILNSYFMFHNSVLIFTDGASKGNPGSGGYAAVIVFTQDSNSGARMDAKQTQNNAKVVELGGREERTTNNRMELRAAIEALSWFDSQELNATSCTLYADSTYLISGITKWIHGWKKNGWRTKTKTGVENRDLWESLDTLVAGKNIEWYKIAGHADTPGNARADEIASTFADGGMPKLYNGSRASYPINLEKIGMREKSKPYDISCGLQQRGKGRRGKAYSYISRVDGVIETHKTWKECEARVKGKKGARYKKSFSPFEEELIIVNFKETKKTD